MNILVTGGTGFLGRYVLPLLANDSEVDKLLYTYRRQLCKELASVQGLALDITKLESFEPYRAVLEEVTCLVHMASVVSHGRVALHQDISQNITANFLSFSNLLQYLPNLKKIIYISSGSAEIYKDDPTMYGVGKMLMEQVLQHIAQYHDIACTILRFPQLYGPGEPHDTFVSKFITSFLDSKPIQLMNDGATVRDILYVKDAAASIVHAVKQASSGVFMVSDPAEHTVGEVAAMLQVITGVDDMHIVRVSSNSTGAPGYHFTSDIDKLGYKLCYTVEQGLKETVRGWNNV